MIQKIRNYLFCILILPFFISANKLPDLEPQDVIQTMEHIFHAHASHKKMTTSLVKRTLGQYLEEFDPTKTYLTELDVKQWIDINEDQLQAILSRYEQADFSDFTHIHNVMCNAIKRRAEMESKIAEMALPKGVNYKEFKDQSYAKDDGELFDRLLRLKALQIATAEKLPEISREKALQRMNKRRVNFEEEILTQNQKERTHLVLANVLKATAASLDAHTAYFTPAEAAQFMIQVQQRLFGIGAQLRDDLNGFTIVKIIEGGPASQNKELKENDRIIAINDEPVVGMEITDAVELIRGEEGSSVKLTVLRTLPDLIEETKLDIELNRGEVVIKEARLESKTIPYGDGIIAHISLYAFYQDPLHSSSIDLQEEFLRIKKDHKVKGVILDLRQNSGGVLPQAVAVTGLFITKGIVVSIKDNQGSVEHLRDLDGKTIWDGPLIVLTSKASASAAEIVAQTLQDYGRAIVVGDEHTFGKGTFQTFTLDAASQCKINPKGEYKVTRGRYYTVSGKSPQLSGVVADIVVNGPFSGLEIGERYAKYALENDQIKENFNDDLGDIPSEQRDQISWLYRFNLQPKIKTFQRFLPQLKQNSAKRLGQQKTYQSFLGDLKKEDIPKGTIEIYNDLDFQFEESVNIIKDLILLVN